MASGFLHPLLGLDHLLAMISIGLWAAFLGGLCRLFAVFHGHVHATEVIGTAFAFGIGFAAAGMALLGG